MLNKYRKINHKELLSEPIIAVYNDLFTSTRKGLPKGTWQKDKNVIIIIRYVLEIKLGLSQEKIPQINRSLIKEKKFGGYKSI